MGLDIRFPIGMMFTLLGLLLLGTGLFTSGDSAMYQRCLGVNVNLWWGGFLLLFGGLMWSFAILGKNKNK